MKKRLSKKSSKPSHVQPVEIQAGELAEVRGGCFLKWLWSIIDGSPPKYEIDGDTAVA